MADMVSQSLLGVPIYGSEKKNNNIEDFLIHSIILKLLPIYDLHNLVAVRRIFWQNVAVVVQVQVVLHAQNGGEFDRPHHHSILASSHLPSHFSQLRKWSRGLIHYTYFLVVVEYKYNTQQRLLYFIWFFSFQRKMDKFSYPVVSRWGKGSVALFFYFSTNQKQSCRFSCCIQPY